MFFMFTKFKDDRKSLAMSSINYLNSSFYSFKIMHKKWIYVLNGKLITSEWHENWHTYWEHIEHVIQ